MPNRATAAQAGRKIAKALKRSKKPLTLSKLESETGLDELDVSMGLSWLKGKGYVSKDFRNRWTLNRSRFAVNPKDNPADTEDISYARSQIRRWAKSTGRAEPMQFYTRKGWERQSGKKTRADLVVCCDTKLLRALRRADSGKGSADDMAVMEEFSEVIGDAGFHYKVKPTHIELYSLSINPKEKADEAGGYILKAYGIDEKGHDLFGAIDDFAREGREGRRRAEMEQRRRHAVGRRDPEMRRLLLERLPPEDNPNKSKKKKKKTLKQRAKTAGKKIKKGAKTDVGRAGIGAGAGALVLGPIGAVAGAGIAMATKKDNKKGKKNPGKSSGEKIKWSKSSGGYVSQDFDLGEGWKFAIFADRVSRGKYILVSSLVENGQIHDGDYAYRDSRGYDLTKVKRDAQKMLNAGLYTRLKKKSPKEHSPFTLPPEDFFTERDTFKDPMKKNNKKDKKKNPDKMVKLSSLMGNLLLDYQRVSDHVEHLATSTLRGDRVPVSVIRKARADLHKAKKIQVTAAEKEQLGELIEALDRVIEKHRKRTMNPASLETAIKRQRQKKARKGASRATLASKAASSAGKLSLRKKLASINPSSYVEQVPHLSDKALDGEHKAISNLIARAKRSPEASERMLNDLTRIRKAITEEKRRRRKAARPMARRMSSRSTSRSNPPKSKVKSSVPAGTKITKVKPGKARGAEPLSPYAHEYTEMHERRGSGQTGAGLVPVGVAATYGRRVMGNPKNNPRKPYDDARTYILFDIGENISDKSGGAFFGWDKSDSRSIWVAQGGSGPEFDEAYNFLLKEGYITKSGNLTPSGENKFYELRNYREFRERLGYEDPFTRKSYEEKRRSAIIGERHDIGLAKKKKRKRKANPRKTGRKHGRFASVYTPSQSDLKLLEKYDAFGTIEGKDPRVIEEFMKGLRERDKKSVGFVRDNELDRLAEIYRKRRKRHLYIVTAPDSTPGEIARHQKMVNDAEQDLALYAEMRNMEPEDLRKYMEHAKRKQKAAKSRRRKSNPQDVFVRRKGRKIKAGPRKSSKSSHYDSSKYDFYEFEEGRSYTSIHGGDINAKAKAKEVANEISDLHNIRAGSKGRFVAVEKKGELIMRLDPRGAYDITSDVDDYDLAIGSIKKAGGKKVHIARGSRKRKSNPRHTGRKHGRFASMYTPTEADIKLLQKHGAIEAIEGMSPKEIEVFMDRLRMVGDGKRKGKRKVSVPKIGGHTVPEKIKRLKRSIESEGISLIDTFIVSFVDQAKKTRGKVIAPIYIRSDGEIGLMRVRADGQGIDRLNEALAREGVWFDFDGSDLAVWPLDEREEAQWDKFLDRYNKARKRKSNPSSNIKNDVSHIYRYVSELNVEDIIAMSVPELLQLDHDLRSARFMRSVRKNIIATHGRKHQKLPVNDRNFEIWLHNRNQLSGKIWDTIASKRGERRDLSRDEKRSMALFLDAVKDGMTRRKRKSNPRHTGRKHGRFASMYTPTEADIKLLQKHGAIEALDGMSPQEIEVFMDRLRMVGDGKRKSNPKVRIKQKKTKRKLPIKKGMPTPIPDDIEIERLPMGVAEGYDTFRQREFMHSPIKSSKGHYRARKSNPTLNYKKEILSDTRARKSGKIPAHHKRFYNVSEYGISPKDFDRYYERVYIDVLKKARNALRKGHKPTDVYEDIVEGMVMDHMGASPKSIRDMDIGQIMTEQIQEHLIVSSPEIRKVYQPRGISSKPRRGNPKSWDNVVKGAVQNMSDKELVALHNKQSKKLYASVAPERQFGTEGVKMLESTISLAEKEISRRGLKARKSNPSKPLSDKGRKYMTPVDWAKLNMKNYQKHMKAFDSSMEVDDPDYSCLIAANLDAYGAEINYRDAGDKKNASKMMKERKRISKELSTLLK